MSEATEAALLKWQEVNEKEGGDCVFEDINAHFDAFKPWDWPNIGEEARRIYSLMFEKIEDNSPMDAFMTAVALAGSRGAYMSVAAALGVNARALESAVAIWYENPTKLPPPISAAELMEEIAKEDGEWQALDAKHPEPPK